MIRRVSVLIGAQLVVGIAAVLVMLTVADVAIEPAPIGFAVFSIVLVGMMRLPPVYVELRRNATWITPTDGAYAVGLVVLGPVGFVLAVGLAELVTRMRSGQALLKRIFNVVSITAGAALGALAYTSAGGSRPLELRTWAGAVVALVVIAAWDTAVSALVLAITEGEPLGSTLRQTALPQGAALAVSIPFGLVALVLFAWAWPSLLLLVPILALLHVSTGATLRQRAERQRVQQLARASAQLVELVAAELLLGRIAEQSRQLVTGAAAVAVAVPGEGEATARLVDDGGEHAVGASLLEAVLGMVGDGQGTRRGEAPAATLDLAIRREVPACTNVLWVVGERADSGALVVAVFRDLLPDGGDAHRADVLATFVAQAATALTNVQLHAAVRRSLEQEQELGRRRDEFVANVSHELRTPLSSIGGAVETLEQRGELLSAADRDTLFDVARTNTRRLRGLIDDLLLVAEGARPERGRRLERVDVAALLEGLDREFRPWTDGSLEVRSELTDGWVTTDGDRLRRILAHLLDNARKYAAGTVVEVTVTQHPSELRLEVADGGPGIAPEDRERVFERFVQLDSSSTRERGGLGLGLHLCRQLAASLDGHLAVDAGPRGGARFTLTLPTRGA